MRKTRILFFLSVVLLILFLMQIYIFQSFVRSLQAWNLGNSREWIIGAVAALFVYLNLTILLRVNFRIFAYRDSWLVRNFLILPGSMWTISTILLFWASAIKEVLLWLWRFFAHDPTLAENPAILRSAGALSIGVPLIITGYGALKTARDYKVETVDIKCATLPTGLDGFTIAHISDIHSGIYMNEREMHNVREIIDSLHPQIAALTGDFVDTRASEIRPVAEVFSRLRTDYGVYACMGNHDLFDDYSKISAAMGESGIVMLENSNQILKVDGEELNLLGVEDTGRRYNYAKLDRALNGVDPEGFKILLAHRPSFFPRAVEAGIDLQLSGHTHGGQIALEFGPIRLNPIYFFEKYARGHYQTGKSQLYVNPGVGMVFAPVRLSIRPEITLLRLKQA